MQKHPFIGSPANDCLFPGCGKGFADDIHAFSIEDAPNIPPFMFEPSAAEKLLTSFPSILQTVLEYKRTETVRSDIARLASALISRGNETPNTAVDTACYLYERIEAATENWGKK